MGEVVTTNGLAHLRLSGFGKIVEAEWYRSFEIRQELYLDSWIMMPNHLHAIVGIKQPDKTRAMEPDDGVADGRAIENHDSDADDAIIAVHGRAPLRLHQQGTSRPRPFYRLPKSVSSFVAGFKSAVNSKIDDYIDQEMLNIPKYNRNNHFFQPDYYDHIVCNEYSYYLIREYIRNNPAKWAGDALNNG